MLEGNRIIMKIGILTFQWSNNYGAALQTFALKSYLSELVDGEVSVIDYKKKYERQKSTLISNVKDFILFFLLIPDKGEIKKRKKRFDNFRASFYNLTKKYKDEKELENNSFDLLFLGSDQIWNPNITGGQLDPVYFGYFNTSARRIAYAASIGEKNVREQDSKAICEYLRVIDAISVREKQIIPEIQKYTDKEVYNTVDPTLLLKEEQYRKIASQASTEKGYVLIYQNTRNDDIYKIAKQVAAARSLRIIEVGYRRQFPLTGIPIIESAGPREFLALYRDADYIVTNTFHGTVFSILFRKEFISIPLKGRESRVINLTEKLGLSGRLVTKYSYDNVKCLLEQKIDYEHVNSLLDQEREKSYSFIWEAVKGDSL